MVNLSTDKPIFVLDTWRNPSPQFIKKILQILAEVVLELGPTNPESDALTIELCQFDGNAK